MEEVEVAVQEREELFPMEPGDELPVGTVADVIVKITRAAYYEDRADALRSEMEATVSQFVTWYKDRIRAAEERQQYHLQQIENYMTNEGRDKVPTPRGTAYFRNSQKIHWPDDDQDLLAWAELDPTRFVRTETLVTPDKKAITEYIKTTGDIPSCVTVEPIRKLVIKAPTGPRNV